MSKTPDPYSSLVPKRRFGKNRITNAGTNLRRNAVYSKLNDTPEDRESVTPECQGNLEATIRYGLELGINHIETARGYGTSEYQLENSFPRSHVMHCSYKQKSAQRTHLDEFLEAFQVSLDSLQLEYVDLLSVHGINNAATLEQAKQCMPAIQRLKQEGRCRHIGFSTHAPPDIALYRQLKPVSSNMLTLHWYYVYHPINRAPVDAAHKTHGHFYY